MEATASPRGSSDDLDGRNGSDPDLVDSHPPKGLPADLPKSLDDRRSVHIVPQETEMYDAWQGSHSPHSPPLLSPPPLSVPCGCGITRQSEIFYAW